MFFSLEPQRTLGIISCAEMCMCKYFHRSTPGSAFAKRISVKNNLIRKVVSEHSQKTRNEKILFSHPEILCTIKITCAQDVREVLLPHTTHTVPLLGLQKCWKFLYKWMFRAGDLQEEIIPEKKLFYFCFGMPHYGGITLRLFSPHSADYS